MVSHLQKDLALEKQDKIHIQKELNDTLTILNKSTSEMGTQTDLTAEQITQMEKDLEQKATKIAELDKSKNELVNQITQKETEINQLKEKVKEEELNPTEKKLIEISPFGGFWDEITWGNYKQRLETGRVGTEVWDWEQLRISFKSLRINLIDYAKTALKKIELEQNLNKEVKSRNQLQTRYDMEVKTKEQLSQELQKERGWWDKWLNDEGEWIRELPVYHDRDFYIKGVPFGSTSMLEGSKIFVGQKRYHYNTISTPANFKIGSISLKYDTSPPSFERITDYVASTYGTFTLRQQKLLFKKSIYEYYKNK